ncbi:heterogeneous nuclear ribonucleoprotein U-like protein 1 [Macrobrachium nipponense]|uniref:heterogeneous nuclear ribonucleoprotein U-like protein 1 n=1 Tax=Macrobrachium nipponense TaxID=159736 RepID=UPI0030C7F394
MGPPGPSAVRACVSLLHLYLVMSRGKKCKTLQWRREKTRIERRVRITKVKEELGNGYDGIMKNEEIDIKEELMEPKQELSDTEDRRGEKRRAHSRSRSPESKKQRPEVEVRVENELEYDRSALLLDRRNKREPDTSREGLLPTAFSAKEFAEPEREPFEKRRGEKRQASSQQGPPGSKRCRPESADKHTDDEPNYDEEAVILDWYNRDLSLIIDKETFLSAKPMTSEDFAYAWHGVRASYGFLRGRLFYEVKVEDHLAVPHLEGEEHPHIVRCGWSIDDAGMTLGEEPFSYGYDGRAKASTDLLKSKVRLIIGLGKIVMGFCTSLQNQDLACLRINYHVGIMLANICGKHFYFYRGC